MVLVVCYLFFFLKNGLEGFRYMESSFRDLRSEDCSDDLRSEGLSHRARPLGPS